jgi:NAD(P)-dependent dehydrogenase (short-subunit alcohol dehydrogenase family)
MKLEDHDPSARPQPAPALGVDAGRKSRWTRRNVLLTAAAGFAGAAAGRRAMAGQTASGDAPVAPPQKQATAPILAAGGRLSGKTAVVTGAARGIGRAIAVAFAQQGADVMGIDICGVASPASEAAPATRQDLDETARMVKQYGRKFSPVVADVRDIKALRSAAEAANRDFGHIDVVVANAAIQTYAPLLTMDDRQWHDVIDVNLNGYANTIRAFAPHLVAHKRGRILMIASGQGRHGTKNAASYSTSKWGVIGLMKCAALELGEYKITVNCIEPGLTDTALTRNPTRYRAAIAEAEHTANPPENPTEEEVARAMAKKSPMHVPWMQPQDIAPVAVFLASDEAHMVSGATYDVTAADSANWTA